MVVVGDMVATTGSLVAIVGLLLTVIWKVKCNEESKDSIRTGDYTSYCHCKRTRHILSALKAEIEY